MKSLQAFEKISKFHSGIWQMVVKIKTKYFLISFDPVAAVCVTGDITL